MCARESLTTATGRLYAWPWIGKGTKNMGHKAVIIAAAAGLLTLSLAASPAAACGCQKEEMIKKYGTLKMLEMDPLPAANLSAPAAAQATTPATPAAPPSSATPDDTQTGG